MGYKDKLCTNFIVRHKERLPYGVKDRGKFIPPTEGRRAIFVPSFGTMEKEEVEDIALAAMEQEDERLKKSHTTRTKENVEYLTNVARNAPRGKRRKTLQEIIGGE